MINGETMAKTQQVQYKYTGGIVDAVRGSLPNYLKQYAKGIANKVLYETTGKKLDDTTEEDLTKAEVDVIKGAITEAAMSGEMEFHNLGTTRNEWKTLGSGVNPIRDAEATIGGATVTVDPETGRVGIKDPYDYSDYPNLSLLEKAMGDAFKDNRLFGAGLGLGPHLVGEGKEGELYFDMQRANAGLNPHMSRDVPYPGAFNTKISMSPVEFVRYAEKLGHKSTPILDTLQRTGMDKNLMESKENFGGGLPGILWQDEAFGTDSAPSQTEDPGYYDEDIDLRRGGQISQGLDNLYMNKRDSKQKLNNMMGFQERQYGGGLDDTYLNMSRRRSNAFADPNANTAFDSPMSIGGLPTVYRQDGGDMDFMSTYTQEDIDEAMASDPPEAEFGDIVGMPTVTTPQGTPPPTNDGMGEAGIPLNFLNSFMIDQRIKNQKAAQEKQAKNQQYRQDVRNRVNIGNVMPGMPPVSNAAMVALRSQIPNTPQRGGVEDPVTRLSQDKANKDTKLSDLSRPEYNTLINTLNDKMNPLQASQFGGSLSLNDKVSEVVDKANKVFFDSTVKDYKGFPNDPLTSYNKKSGGGLSTIYRDIGGLTDPGGGNYMSPSDPSDDELGDVGGSDSNFDPYPSLDPGLAALTGRGQSIPVTAPPTTPPSWTPAAGRDTEGYLSTPIPSGLYEMSTGSGTKLMNTLYEIWDRDKAEQKFNSMSDQEKRNFESAFHGKNFLGDINADDYTKGYRHGGARGTLLSILEESAMDKYGIGDFIRDDAATRKEDRDLDLVDSDASKDDLNERGLTDDVINLFTSFFSAGKAEEMSPRTIMSINNTLKNSGATYSPPDGGGAIGKLVSLAAPFPLNLAFNAATRNSRGSITTRDGTTFNIGKDGRFTYANLPDADIDYGNESTPTRQPRPVEKKKVAPKTEEKKATAEKTSDLPSIKESNIERLKTYMSLTGKDLSDSKQDLAITDISITEEDFT